jgi:two-component system nitrogen regulation response regulator GlnG
VATHRNLEEQVRQGTFREDLYHRVFVFPIVLPPLRERREDIPLLADHFLNGFAREQKQPPKTLTAGALEALQGYDWPGNVRELQTVIRRALVLGKGEAILASDLPSEIANSNSVPQDGRLTRVTSDRDKAPEATVVARQFFRWAKTEPGAGILPAVQRELVAQALLETNGNQGRAAKLLGITRTVLRNRMIRSSVRGNPMPSLHAAGD